MTKNRYFLERYVRCGAMPVFLVFYSDRRGNKGHCAMLCSVKMLLTLIRQYKGFKDPSQYGRVIFRGFESEPGEMLKQIIKARYGFDLDTANGNENRLT